MIKNKDIPRPSIAYHLTPQAVVKSLDYAGSSVNKSRITQQDSTTCVSFLILN